MEREKFNVNLQIFIKKLHKETLENKIPWSFANKYAMYVKIGDSIVDLVRLPTDDDEEEHYKLSINDINDLYIGSQYLVNSQDEEYNLIKEMYDHFVEYYNNKRLRSIIAYNKGEVEAEPYTR